MGIGLADPIQWQVTDGGNGHYYEKVTTSMSWEEAQSHASSQNWLGLQGYLATVSSLTENDWIFNTFAANGCLLGGFQPPGSVEPLGEWQWITDDSWTFTNWAPGEPNDSGGNEDYLQFTNYGLWNDIGPSSNFFIVEYGETDHIIEYSIRINVEKQYFDFPRDFGTIAGISTGATDQYDQNIDQPEVPHAPQDFVTCYFPHPEWDSPFGSQFNVDYQGSIDPYTEFAAWDIVLETDHTYANFLFHVTVYPDPPLDFQIIVLESDGGQQWNLNSTSTFQVNSLEGTRHLRLVLGNDYETLSMTTWSEVKVLY